jgi:deoxycytidylate deaminase
MRILNGTEEEIAIEHMNEAAEVAAQALCLRARCGTVIVKDGEVIGQGYNAPPGDDISARRCERKHELAPTFKSDKTCCIHAEQRAIMDALAHHSDKINGSTLYFTRVDDENKIIFSGEPYCTICSKMSLDAGIAEFVLWHESGITAYDTREYNELSFKSK